MSFRSGRALALLALLLAGACGGGAAGRKPLAPHAGPLLPHVLRTAGRPPVSAVLREGDASSAAAVVIATDGIATDAGDAVAVALAALLEGRLRGVPELRIVPQSGVVRLSALLSTPTEAAAFGDAVRGALLAPFDGAGDEGSRVKRKLDALARLPRLPAQDEAFRCGGRLRGAAVVASAADVDRWRKEAAVLARVAFACTGPRPVADALFESLAHGPTWDPGTPVPPVRPGAAVAQYDAADGVATGTAKVTLALWMDSARTAGAAGAIADPSGPMIARLGATDSPASAFEVRSTVLAGRGCVSLTFTMPARPGDVVGLATAAAMAQRELLLAAEDAKDEPPSAPDPRDAAELAALDALRDTNAIAPPSPRLGGVAVGIPSDATTKQDEATPVVAALTRELAAATERLARPVVETRGRVESGQAELILLLASPCGTTDESAGDAGLSAVVASAAAARVRDAYGVEAEPWIAADGVGVLGRAKPRPGESAEHLGRRVADAVARAFLVDPLTSVARRRTELSAAAREPLGSLATALVPAHPSWIVPTGLAASLLQGADSAASARLDALRRGPLRAVVLANVDQAQSAATLRAVDRWAPRTGAEPRACTAVDAPPAPRPGTYAFESDGASEAYLALPFDRRLLPEAQVLAAHLDETALPRALGDGVARSFSARILGAPRAPALVVHVDAPSSALDAAVAQVRVLFDRLRRGALEDADRTRALARVQHDRRDARLDPRGRAIDDFRGEKEGAAAPSLDALRAFAGAVLRDEALVIVAARPHTSKP